MLRRSMMTAALGLALCSGGAWAQTAAPAAPAAAAAPAPAMKKSGKPRTGAVDRVFGQG